VEIKKKKAASVERTKNPNGSSEMVGTQSTTTKMEKSGKQTKKEHSANVVFLTTKRRRKKKHPLTREKKEGGPAPGDRSAHEIVTNSKPP